MLSFDITDKNVRIIKGVESNGTIKISKAANIKVEKEYIINGSVMDVQGLGLLVQKTLLQNKMSEKEAVLSISSNYTIFKELTVPKVKDSDFPKQVKMEMQKTVGIDETYAVSYIIVGSAKDSSGNEIKEGNASVVTVLATACPQDLIDSYKRVFDFLDIQLKSVVIGCNCITKLLLSDPKVKSQLPLLAVQVDENFINLNIYEDDKLTFSRFASIDPADYGNSKDYVIRAVDENVSRMLQFQKNRNPENIIENIIFYGDTRDYDKLVSLFDDMNTSIIKVPPHIKGYENLEFSEFANAIGALFKRNKDTEKINLLESGGTVSIINDKIKSDSSFKLIMIGSLAAALVVMGGITGVLKIMNANIKSDIKKQVDYMEAQSTIDDLAKYDDRNAMLENVRNYKNMAFQADNAFKSQAVLNQETINKLDELLKEASDELGVEAYIDNTNYSDGMFGMKVVVDASKIKEEVPKLPALFSQKIAECGYFAGVEYSGYNLKSVSTTIHGETEIDEDGNVVSQGQDQKVEAAFVECDVYAALKGGEAELEDPADAAVADQTTGEEGNE